jgi:ubiquinone/menaquinone biosynthesis C-methylase UbiE
MLSLLKKLPVLIYDFFISTFLTIAAHVQMIDNMTMLKGNFLDVGCGTGAPLKKIVDKLETYYTKIIGVDLHTEYTQKASEVFQADPLVEIHNCDFYEIKKVVGSKKFSTILFSFSFMLMPDHIKALMLSQSILEKDGRICFLMTLNKKGFPLLEKIKPLIKKITTVDFGRVVYEKEFDEVLGIANLETTKKVRIQTFLNPFLYIFPVYYVECKVKG